jgi:hypothetical protein
MTGRLRLSLLGALLAAVTLSGCRSSKAVGRGDAPPSPAQPDYRDVAAESGLNYTWRAPRNKIWTIRDGIGAGCAFLDFDQDGWMDVFLVGRPRCGLFRNNGDGTLTDVTSRMRLTQPGEWIGVAVGDYDNDGFPDLYLSGFACLRLLHNEQGRRFADRTAASGLREKEWGTSCAFFDKDGDGDLDLLVGHYVETAGYPELCPSNSGVRTGCQPMVYPPQFPRLYQNDGQGHFKAAGAAAGMGMAHGKTLALQLADYDNDGLTDVYLANDAKPADLFHNLGQGRFENVSLQAGAAMGMDGQAQAGMGIDFGDYDRDGLLDLAVATYREETFSLYHSLGGMFEPASGKAGLGVTRAFLGFGTRFFDFDDDTWPDLVFANGHVFNNAAEVEPGATLRQKLLLLQNRSGAFERVTEGGPGLQKEIVGRGLAIGDLKNDGSQDLLVVDCDGSPLLLRNRRRSTNHWLGVRLRGTHGNRDAYGARVTVKWPGGESFRDASGGGSYLSVSDPRLHFGLGASTGPVEVTVRWASGESTTYPGVPVDRYVLLTEGDERFKLAPPGGAVR